MLKRTIALILLFTSVFGQAVAPRSSFNVPLVKMTLGMNKAEDRHFKHVRVAINGTKEYAIITRYHDTHVKTSRSGTTERTMYQESPDRAFIISDFEAKQLNRVVRSFISTLEIFERDLKRKDWDRCRYLDSFFPRFLKRFYFLVCASRNSTHAMPRISKIPDSEYDVSLNSLKSDKRIEMWKQQPDYALKLRIISKELVYQLKWWQKKELDNSRRNLEVAYSAKAEEAYGLFIQMYFNLHPPPRIPSNGKHL